MSFFIVSGLHPGSRESSSRSKSFKAGPGEIACRDTRRHRMPTRDATGQQAPVAGYLARGFKRRIVLRKSRHAKHTKRGAEPILIAEAAQKACDDYTQREAQSSLLLPRRPDGRNAGWTASPEWSGRNAMYRAGTPPFRRCRKPEKKAFSVRGMTVEELNKALAHIDGTRVISSDK